MTFREKLTQEHPEEVGEEYGGGCSGCPCDYGYEEKDDDMSCFRKSCYACWSREIPMTPEEQERHDLKINAEILHGYCGAHPVCDDCPANKACHYGEWDEPCYKLSTQLATLAAFKAALPLEEEDGAERTDTPQNETNTPDNIVRHARVCTELLDLYKRKNADYGDSFHRSYEEWGLTMAAIRICDKYNRFAQLVHKGGDSLVKDESIRDTLIDLANYAIMTVMELDEERNDKNGNET